MRRCGEGVLEAGLTEVEEEGNAVEDEDVGDMCDVGAGDERHLLFCGAHEEETCCAEELVVVSIALDTSVLKHWTRLTKGVKCWKLCTSAPVGSTQGLSLSTKLISTILAAPAAISVQPNALCTIVLSINSCGCALIP